MEQFYQPLVEFINEQYALIDEGKTTSTISVFDIDDTILFAKSQIRYKEPGKSWASVGTSDFADVRHKLDPDTEYDFDDFTDYKKISMGMAGGKPNIPILKMMDKAIADGHKIGIITARGNQKAIWSTIPP